MKKRKVIITIIATAFCILTFVLLWPITLRTYLQLGWSGMWCEYQDVDINTGRIRYTRNFWHRKTSERIERTLITEALSKDFLANSTSEWKRVYTIPFIIGISPSYLYHSAILRIRTIERDWETNSISRGEQQEIAKKVIKYWHENKRDF